MCSADRLAAFAGLAPTPRDSGRISGNLRRPQRYNRRLLRACHLAAQISTQCHPERLARRRMNAPWAMLRDHQLFRPEPPGQEKTLDLADWRARDLADGHHHLGSVTVTFREPSPRDPGRVDLVS